MGLSKDKQFAEFLTFPKDSFYTKNDYALEHGGDTMSGLNAEIKHVPVATLGVCNFSIGKEWHFNRPVQTADTDMFRTWRWDDSGKMTRHLVTLPEYMKLVFEDHGIKYDFRTMINSIKEAK